MGCHVVGAGAKKNAQAPPPPAKSPAIVNPAAYQAPADTQRTPVDSTPVPVDTHIVSGATVFIQPMEGFENYIAAAFQKNSVPLVPVPSYDQACYALWRPLEGSKTAST